MSDEPRDATAAAEPALPAALVAALDTLDRELHAMDAARALKRRNLSPMLAQLALRALQSYLAGDRDRATQIFESISEDLRDRTMQLPPP